MSIRHAGPESQHKTEPTTNLLDIASAFRAASLRTVQWSEALDQIAGACGAGKAALVRLETAHRAKSATAGKIATKVYVKSNRLEHEYYRFASTLPTSLRIKNANYDVQLIFDPDACNRAIADERNLAFGFEFRRELWCLTLTNIADETDYRRVLRNYSRIIDMLETGSQAIAIADETRALTILDMLNLDNIAAFALDASEEVLFANAAASELFTDGKESITYKNNLFREEAWRRIGRNHTGAWSEGIDNQASVPRLT